jgi:hypothetical protein
VRAFAVGAGGPVETPYWLAMVEADALDHRPVLRSRRTTTHMRKLLAWLIDWLDDRDLGLTVVNALVFLTPVTGIWVATAINWLDRP